MGVTAEIDEKKYSRLLAKALPKVIESDAELGRMAAQLEHLLIPERELTPEESALAALMLRLIEDYDDKYYPIPDGKPHEMVQFLMEQKGLKQADLVSLIGSRAQVSDLVTGKRGISKAQAKKLAEFFRVSPELFI